MDLADILARATVTEGSILTETMWADKFRAIIAEQFPPAFNTRIKKLPKFCCFCIQALKYRCHDSVKKGSDECRQLLNTRNVARNFAATM